MSVEPKIYKNEDIKKLKECYIDKKMSTVDIEKNSKSIFGFYVSRGTIYKTMKKHNIGVRNKSHSVSIAMSVLDFNKTFLTENVIEWIDGFNLGDGYIGWDKRKNNTMGARFIIGSSTKNWSIYAMKGLRVYQPNVPKPYQKIDDKHPNQIWDSKTKTHPDIVKQAKRWYCQGKKKIPHDIRITPTSVLLWYLGDGSLSYTQKGNIARLRLATCDFLKADIQQILIPKLERLGIRCEYEKSKNDIRICADSIRKFFDLIGRKSPVPEYQYKFEYPSWLDLIRLSDIVQNNKEKYRAQYYYKTGQIECSKSPGGKMLLFTEEQAEKLKNKLT